MGYYMSATHAYVEIVDPEGALAALKALRPPPCGHFSWVDLEVVQRAVTVVDALREWRWGCHASGQGFAIGEFLGEKSGDDLTMFCAIAPFVRAGDYIEMDGEDGARWRWVFDGATCHEVTPHVTWPTEQVCPGTTEAWDSFTDDATHAVAGEWESRGLPRPSSEMLQIVNQAISDIFWEAWNAAYPEMDDQEDSDG